MRSYVISLEIFLLSFSSTSAWVGRSAKLNSLTEVATPSKQTSLNTFDTPKECAASTFIETSKTAASLAICSLLLTATIPARPTFAYESTDYASETVQIAVKAVNEAVGNMDETVQAYETIAKIITEGKGVGGEINFKGVQLDRGFVSDEDTAIYNPGLTLLTEGEKDRLVEAIVQSKKLSTNWNQDAEAGYSFLRDRLDPLHMYELRGYLTIVPFYGAALYLAALAVQQLARDLFPPVYILCALAVFAPAIVLVFLGP